MRLLHQIGAVGPACSHSGLLHSRVHGERRAAGQRGDIQELPAPGESSSQRPQKTYMVERQDLDHAQSKGVGRVECGRAFFRARVPGILGHSLQHHARSRDRAPQHRAGVVNRFGIGVAGLQAKT